MLETRTNDGFHTKQVEIALKIDGFRTKQVEIALRIDGFRTKHDGVLCRALTRADALCIKDDEFFKFKMMNLV